MAERTMETTDGVYVRLVGQDGRWWWDTRGIRIVPERIVDAYLKRHPRVGVMIGERH
jgi:hypothetical protein